MSVTLTYQDKSKNVFSLVWFCLRGVLRSHFNLPTWLLIWEKIANLLKLVGSLRLLTVHTCWWFVFAFWINPTSTPTPWGRSDRKDLHIISGSWWLNHNPAMLLQTLMEFAWGPNNPIWFISKHARNVWICMIILSASVSIKNAFWLRIRKDWGENSTNWFNKLTAFCISG